MPKGRKGSKRKYISVDEMNEKVKQEKLEQLERTKRIRQRLGL